MQNRWFVLGVLFLVRMTMAFQFQITAAIAPLYMQTFGVGLADIGMMIGLYLAPGLIFAYPGGAIGGRMGDKQAVTLGLGLMVAGSAAMALLPSWEAQIAGRVLAGIGGTLLNVLMSKMVTDNFAGREISTAMGIFVNSWPVGIALALVAVPMIAAAGGLAWALWSGVLLPALGLCLFVLAYRPSGADPSGAVVDRVQLGRQALLGVLTAGAIWGLYNASLSMIFGFGPAMLAERGWSLQSASSTISVVLWMGAISIPLGGMIADRTGHKDTVLIVGVVGMALALLVTAQPQFPYAAFVAMGLIAGIAAGPIMSLPSEVLAPGNRAAGMGVFYTVFYACVVMAPILAGRVADAFQSARAPFFLGAVMLGLCLLALALFRRIAAR